MSAADEAYENCLEDRFYNMSLAEKAMCHLNKMPNEKFLEFILLHCSRDCLNDVVPDGKFPAYNIVQRAKDNCWQLTFKQRHAITNVYLWCLYGWKQEQLEAGK